jgi:hypothetical protein
MKYGLAVLGLVAVLAIIAAWNIDIRTAVRGALLILVLMVPLLVFAKLTQIANKHFLLPALVLMWTFVLLTILVGIILFCATTLGIPKPVHDLIFSTERASQDSDKRDPSGRAEPVMPAAMHVTTSVERVTVDDSPEQIWATFAGKTQYEADLIVNKIYRGKWLTIELPIEDISSSPRHQLGSVYLSFRGLGPKSVLHSIYAYFDQSSEPKVNHLQKGTVVKLMGKIVYVDETWIYLSKCELVTRDKEAAHAIEPSKLAVVIPPTWLTANSSAPSQDGRILLSIGNLPLNQDGVPWVINGELSALKSDNTDDRALVSVFPAHRQTLELAGARYSVAALEIASNRVKMAVHELP